MDDFPKLDKVIEREGERIIKWCEEWRFEGEEGGRGEWDEDGEKAERKSAHERETFGKSPSWEECVEKCEELMWMATVRRSRLFAGSSSALTSAKHRSSTPRRVDQATRMSSWTSSCEL